jgi:hypothetical protein
MPTLFTRIIAGELPGHTLVVSREEVDQWTGAAAPLLRVGLVIGGFEVPHLHVHVFPAYSMEDFDFSRAVPAREESLDQAAAKLRAVLGTGTDDRRAAEKGRSSGRRSWTPPIRGAWPSSTVSGSACSTSRATSLPHPASPTPPGRTG